jgi:hypothetical protein
MDFYYKQFPAREHEPDGVQRLGAVLVPERAAGQLVIVVVVALDTKPDTQTPNPKYPDPDPKYPNPHYPISRSDRKSYYPNL